MRVLWHHFACPHPYSWALANLFGCRIVFTARRYALRGLSYRNTVRLSITLVTVSSLWSAISLSSDRRPITQDYDQWRAIYRHRRALIMIPPYGALRIPTLLLLLLLIYYFITLLQLLFYDFCLYICLYIISIYIFLWILFIHIYLYFIFIIIISSSIVVD